MNITFKPSFSCNCNSPKKDSNDTENTRYFNDASFLNQSEKLINGKRSALLIYSSIVNGKTCKQSAGDLLDPSSKAYDDKDTAKNVLPVARALKDVLSRIIDNLQKAE